MTGRYTVKTTPSLKAITKKLDAMLGLYGTDVTAHAVRHWLTTLAERQRLLKDKARLEKELADLDMQIKKERK